MSATMGTALGNATAMAAVQRNSSIMANDTLVSGQGDNVTGMYDLGRTNSTDGDEFERENIGQAVLVFYLVLVCRGA